MCDDSFFTWASRGIHATYGVTIISPDMTIIASEGS